MMMMFVTHYRSFCFSLSLSLLFLLSPFDSSLCAYISVCMHIQLKVFILPIAVIAAETTRTTRTKTITTVTISSLRINNEQRRFSSFHTFSLLLDSFIVCVCVCVCIENKKIVTFVSRPNKKADDIGDFRIVVLL